jgi:hypothetical protein
MPKLRDKRWNEAYASLRAYKRCHPHAWPRRDYIAPDGRRLGEWCHNVRSFRHRGLLAPERGRRLDAIGFPWRAPAGPWQARFEDLLHFRKRHPAAWPAKSHVSRTRARLGLWCREQRRARRWGTLRSEHVRQLDAIGFPWNQVPYEANWEKGFGELARWRRSRPDVWPLARYVTPGLYELGSWCHKQRQRRRKGGLSSARIRRLDEIGFPWNLKADLWPEAFNALRAFRRVHRRAWPSVSYVTPGGLKLGYWLNNARVRMRSGMMPRERARALQRIGVRF